jgi:hypothetical protein
MRSSSADPAGRPATRSVERGTWLRLAVALLIGATALVVPWAASGLDRTGAVFTDHEQTSDDLTGGPTPTPTPSASVSDSPTASVALQSLKGQPRTPKATSKTP